MNKIGFKKLIKEIAEIEQSVTVTSPKGRWKIRNERPQGLFVGTMHFGQWFKKISTSLTGTRTWKVVEEQSQKTLGYIRTTSKGVKWFKNYSDLQSFRAAEKPAFVVKSDKKTDYFLIDKEIKKVRKEEFIDVITGEKEPLISAKFWNLMGGLFFVVGSMMSRRPGQTSLLNQTLSLTKVPFTVPLTTAFFLQHVGLSGETTIQVGSETQLSDPGTTNMKPTVAVTNGVVLTGWQTQNQTDATKSRVNTRRTDQNLQPVESVKLLPSTSGESQFEPVSTSFSNTFILGVSKAQNTVDPTCANCTRGFEASSITPSTGTVTQQTTLVPSGSLAGDYRLASNSSNLFFGMRNYTCTFTRYTYDTDPVSGIKSQQWCSPDIDVLTYSDLAGGDHFASSYSFALTYPGMGLIFHRFSPSQDIPIIQWKYNANSNSQFPLTKICTFIGGSVVARADSGGVSTFVLPQNGTLLPLWNVTYGANAYTDLTLACNANSFAVGWGEKSSSSSNVAAKVALGDPNTNNPIVGPTAINSNLTLNQTGIKFATINSTAYAALYNKGPDIFGATLIVSSTTGPTSGTSTTPPPGTTTTTPPGTGPTTTTKTSSTTTSISGTTGNPTSSGSKPTSGTSSTTPTVKTGSQPITSTSEKKSGPSASSKETDSTGIIAGVIAGIIACFSFFIALFGFFFYRKRKRDQANALDEIKLVKVNPYGSLLPNPKSEYANNPKSEYANNPKSEYANKPKESDEKTKVTNEYANKPKETDEKTKVTNEYANKPKETDENKKVTNEFANAKKED